MTVAQNLDQLDGHTDEVQRVQSATRRAYIRAGLTATWLQSVIDNAAADSEAVSMLRGTMHVPLFRERVKVASDLRFMAPRGRRP